MVGTNASGRPRALVGMAHPERGRQMVVGLRQDGWSVTIARDGYHLVRLMADAILMDTETARPDLIICDATMAGCTGLTVLRGIRDLHWATPVIVITDFNRPDAMQEALSFGASRVFEKPVNVEEVRVAALSLRLREPEPPRRVRTSIGSC